MFVYPSSSSPLRPVSSLQTPLPTLESAKKTYWALGDRFWMQIMDGKYHKFGKMVFDEALHGGPKEPGFFNSLNEGCRLAVEYLGEKPTIHFYKELHKKLCSHFQGEKTQTKMKAKQAGVFRNTRSSSAPLIKSFTC
jgi:hypothetical protein